MIGILEIKLKQNSLRYNNKLPSLNNESNSKNAVFMRFLRLFNNDLITK